MAVTDQQRAAIRAYLSANPEVEGAGAERQFIVLARTGGVEGIGELLYAVFVIAARRAFAPSWKSADIIRFVAEVRSGGGEVFNILDPSVAEKQLRVAVGKELVGSLDEEGARAQLILLAALAERLGLTAQGLDQLLSDGRALADRLIWTGGRTASSTD